MTTRTQSMQTTYQTGSKKRLRSIQSRPYKWIKSTLLDVFTYNPGKRPHYSVWASPLVACNFHLMINPSRPNGGIGIYVLQLLRPIRCCNKPTTYLPTKVRCV